MPKLGDKHYAYTEEGKTQYKKDKKRLGMKSGSRSSLFDKIKEAWKARENNILRAEREGNIEDLTASIVEQENKIADRLLEIAEKNEKYADRAEGFFTSPSTPSSYVVSDESHDYRNKRREKSLASEVLGGHSVSPFSWIFGAIGRRGLKHETMPESEYKRLLNSAGTVATEVQKEIEMERRNAFQEGGTAIDEQMADIMPEEEAMPTETMLPDEEMEGNYIDFVIDEALEPEEEQYLLDRLSGDEQLSMIFDKVVETASEFAGSGLVEGPGSAVSDSIPARLSDGEFVITSKAANQIGPDNLQGMMEQAELDVDMDEVKRQIKQAGGYVEEEEENKEEKAIVDSTLSGNKSVVIPSSITDRKIKESMLSLNPRNSLFTS